MVIDCLDIPAEQVAELAADLRACARKHDPEATSYTVERWRIREFLKPDAPPLLPPISHHRHQAEHTHRMPSRRRGPDG